MMFIIKKGVQIPKMAQIQLQYTCFLSPQFVAYDQSAYDITPRYTWHMAKCKQCKLPYPTYIYLGNSHIKRVPDKHKSVAIQHQPREHCINDIIILRNINTLSHTIMNTYSHLSSHAYHQRISRSRHISLLSFYKSKRAFLSVQEAGRGLV